MSGTAASRDRLDVEQLSAIADAIGEAVAALPTLAAAATESGARFRQFDLASAHDDLTALAQNLGSLLLLTDTVAGLLWGTAAYGQVQTAGVPELATSVEALITARAADDWIQVADILEHEIPGLLDRWSQLFAAMSRELRS